MPVYYFITMFFLLFAAAFIITGWYASTRGELYVNPDGSIEKTGYIFKSWYFFWFQEIGTKKIEYKGVQFTGKLYDANNYTKLGLIKVGEGMFAGSKEFIDRIPDFQKLFNCKVDWKPVIGSETSITGVFYDEGPVYKYPEWLRTVLAGCITCFASIYGSIIFWVANFFIINSKYYEQIYGWCNYPKALLITSWIGYVFALAYMNTIMWNKFKFAK